MMRARLVHGVIILAVALVVLWIVRNTEWGDVSVASPLRGEAARNPFYAAQRLVATLEATSERRESLGPTSPGAVVVLSTWGWDIDARRQRELEQWVEAGGRLVVDAALVSGSDAFENWSGIARARLEEDPAEEDVFQTPEVLADCELLFEIDYGVGRAGADPMEYEVCDFDRASWLESDRQLLWALDSEYALQAARVAVGQGTVTVINGVPFVYRAIFDGDHGELFATATQLRTGDHVVFISEEDVSALPELVWRHGAPVVVVLLLWIALALWRGALRFGPLVAAGERARRSLGEQILGTGRFIVRVGGTALHTAAARALHEAAARRVAGYERLPSAERSAAVARLAGIDGAALTAALADGKRRPLELRSALALLETARRQLISRGQWSKHGKRI